MQIVHHRSYSLASTSPAAQTAAPEREPNDQAFVQPPTFRETALAMAFAVAVAGLSLVGIESIGL